MIDVAKENNKEVSDARVPDIPTCNVLQETDIGP